METSELLRRAWNAVEESGVPESMQEAAFREAVEHLRSGEGPGSTPSGEAKTGGKRSWGKSGSPRKATPGGDNETGSPVDESTFYAELSKESGVDEDDLRDVLSFSSGTVHVTPPTRNLGSTTATQARAVIALVAGARAFGAGERPVNADAVRTELERKRCYQSNNFASKHLGPLRGFNAGADRTEIVTTSRWVGEFAAAVEQALSREIEPEPVQKD